MKPESESPKEVILSNIPEEIVALLLQIPGASEINSREAAGRLFPQPCDSKRENRQVAADWKEFVQPELKRLFQSSREIVEKDLEGLQPNSAPQTLRIPFDHLDAWINALNQVRLAISEFHGIGEDEVNLPLALDSGNWTPRNLAVLRIHFYGTLQYLLITEICKQMGLPLDDDLNPASD